MNTVKIKVDAKTGQVMILYRGFLACVVWSTPPVVRQKSKRAARLDTKTLAARFVAEVVEPHREAIDLAVDEIIAHTSPRTASPEVSAALHSFRRRYCTAIGGQIPMLPEPLEPKTLHKLGNS